MGWVEYVTGIPEQRQRSLRKGAIRKMRTAMLKIDGGKWASDYGSPTELAEQNRARSNRDFMRRKERKVAIREAIRHS